MLWADGVVWQHILELMEKPLLCQRILFSARNLWPDVLLLHLFSSSPGSLLLLASRALAVVQAGLPGEALPGQPCVPSRGASSGPVPWGGSLVAVTQPGVRRCHAQLC